MAARREAEKQAREISQVFGSSSLTPASFQLGDLEHPPTKRPDGQLVGRAGAASARSPMPGKWAAGGVGVRWGVHAHLLHPRTTDARGVLAFDLQQTPFSPGDVPGWVGREGKRRPRLRAGSHRGLGLPPELAGADPCAVSVLPEALCSRMPRPGLAVGGGSRDSGVQHVIERALPSSRGAVRRSPRQARPSPSPLRSSVWATRLSTQPSSWARGSRGALTPWGAASSPSRPSARSRG